MPRVIPWLLLLAAALMPQPAAAEVSVDELLRLVKDGYADSNGVKIHYVTAGEGPLVLFIHGFPDQWFTWRHQMAALADEYQVVAISQRGYNLSDKPKGVEHYKIDRLTADVAAVLRHLGRDKATIVGHDWGGSVAWRFAMDYPDIVERLVVFNRPHPRGRDRELATNNEHKRAASYIIRFLTTTGASGMTAERTAERYKNTPLYERYLEAFQRSDFEAMINYYRANYPPPPFLVPEGPVTKVKVPVLLFHGLEDRALLHHSLNGTWEWLDGDLTLMTLPGVGHDSQNTGDVALVTRMLEAWLKLHE